MNTRDKGYRLENDTVHFMLDLDQVFRRVSMSGQLEGEKGDFKWVKAGKIFTGEAKSGGHVPKWLYDTLEKDESDFLVLRRDRKSTLFVLTEEMMERLLS